jgi:hypothetical protein
MKNHHPITDQSEFIWSLLYFYFIKHCLDSVIKLASSMYDQDIEFTQVFENLILKLWETSDVQYIIRIAKEAVFQRLFDIEKYIFTIALLVERGEINISDAALLLKVEKTYDYASLNAKIRHVIDVAWLVNEDTKDGIMTPNDDSVLFDALNDVRSIYLTR